MGRKQRKSFDCVEFKRQAQARIRAEWEKRKHEFSSYEAFLKATESESERAFWERVGKTAKR